MVQPIAQQSRKAVVLAAEDDPDHLFLVTESLQEARVQVDLHHVATGDQCLAFLRRQPPYENAPRPDLVLLDMHMPRMGGMEVMEVIDRDPALRCFPVIVLSTSAELSEVNRMYELGCSSYVTKPVDFVRYIEMVGQLANYWFELVVLPRQE
jgi:CheY-like chemotaxis protein